MKTVGTDREAQSMFIKKVNRSTGKASLIQGKRRTPKWQNLQNETKKA